MIFRVIENTRSQSTGFSSAVGSEYASVYIPRCHGNGWSSTHPTFVLYAYLQN